MAADTELMRVVIDTDPGIDDALAILYALNSGLFDVLGIVTVAGNLGIETTTRNAGRILALAGRQDIPVIEGAHGPISRTATIIPEIHGDDGLGYVSFPEPAAPPLTTNATGWLHTLLEAEPPRTIDVLALGPLTNIARLIRDHPRAAGRIRRVIAMGGALNEPGNSGPLAEFNLATDPEAAAMVFASGLPVTLVPLDVTRRVRATRDVCAALREAGGTIADVSAGLIDAFFVSRSGRESRPLHDPCVMLLAAYPDLFGLRRVELRVDISGGPDAGTLMPVTPGDHILVATEVVVDKALAAFLTGLVSRIADTAQPRKTSN